MSLSGWLLEKCGILALVIAELMHSLHLQTCMSALVCIYTCIYTVHADICAQQLLY